MVVSWRYREGPGRSLLFFLAKMGQELVESLSRFTRYEVLVFDAGDDSGRATAATTNGNIDIEYSVESLAVFP
ncbi:MAG: hypothetical protein HRT77_01385 [Halioglobus sp.]|nr:hypothetical protein [Halioglobus sp.]